MTWSKLGDEFSDECWRLSDAAFRLHVEGIVWSNKKSLDGRLAKDDMVRWAKRPAAADELIAAAWWEDHGDHFQVVHHAGYQRSAEQVARQSLVNRANRRKGKARPVRGKDDSSDGSSNLLSDNSLDESSDHSSPHDESSDEVSDEMDRTGQAWTREEGGYSEEASLCEDCREVPPLGAAARGSDDPRLCRPCNDIRTEDYLAAIHEDA